MPRTTFRALTVVLAAGMAMGTSLPAFALSGQRPARPSLDQLATGDRPCDAVTPTEVRFSPTLRAVLNDPDGDPVSAQFEVTWNTEGSTEPSRLRAATTFKADGSAFSWTVPDTVPEGPVSWRVRAKDADGYGPWSDSLHQGRCQYVKDGHAPAAPQVTSSDIPLGSDEWVDAVGRYPAFTFASASPDVTAYRYAFGVGAVAATARPDERGGPVTVRLTPPSPGVTTLEVQSVDGAGNVSEPTRYTILVGSPAGDVARWKLDDPVGSMSAEAAAGGTPAWLKAGVTFGAEGPSGTTAVGAAAFDGSYGAGLVAETGAADSTKTFTVSAWVRPEETDLGMTAVSQTGFLAPSNFSLGTALGEDGQPSFTFSLPGTAGATRITGGSPMPGDWSHLTGVYNPVTGTAQLYVDGALAGSGDAAVPDGTQGYLQIGREMEDDGIHWTGAWHGDIADVRVWDRIVLPDEIADIGHRTPQRTGYWAMNTVRTDESYIDTPDAGGSQSLILSGDAHLDTTDPLTGEGSISLDGDGDYLDSDGHQVDTDRSYTVTAQVRLHEWLPEQDMAILAQGGDEADAFTLRYRGSDTTWEAVFAHADTAEAPATRLTAFYGEGTHHLAVQYDSKAGQVRLFVDGTLADSAPYSATDAWNAYRALQVGRDGAGQGGSHHLDGDVDEVRTYAGVLSPTEIRRLCEPGEHPDL
ncbi:LamG domain-containing protein (plasmid) [Streptomyces sp. NBC_00464]|uniref:LamG domain-containing protein n=1 Tax=Streptomyces sp. NBC_00464 TaxID=2975751 RepID=UPI002E19A089